MRRFQVASDDEIKNGETTDVYFTRTKEILEKEGLSDLRVTAEITTGSLPRNWEWGIPAGVEEAAHLLEGVPIDVHSFPEGTLFHSSDVEGVREPVMVLEGRYLDFCLYETPLLGLLCQASGITTMAARVRKAAGEKTLLSFGIRRAHPALAPMIDRSCYIGGFDEVSSIVGGKLLGKDPAGTMPHSLIIAMVDTYYDEKTESILAAEALGKDLFGVRLDTPSSRRGNFAEIIREVRWELESRGYNHVKIFVSGGLNDESVADLSLAGADGFGVGTSVSNAPSIDFALDIVEADGKPVAKRGKLGGRKIVWRCDDCLTEKITGAAATAPKCPNCGGKVGMLLAPILSKGRLSKALPSADHIRERVLGQLGRLSAS